MSRQAGNEIDEFVTDVLRNQLVGIPLDLAALNLARGRDVGLPTLQEARAQFYEASGMDTQLKPYESWSDFALNLQNTPSIVNFIAFSVNACSLSFSSLVVRSPFWMIESMSCSVILLGCEQEDNGHMVSAHPRPSTC